MIAGAKGEDIEEDDDLDKEIALLEQKVKTFGDKIEITKTKESILNIYDNSLKMVYEKFNESCQKFDKFYNETQLGLYFDGGGNSNDLIRERRERFNDYRGDEIKQINLSYYFKIFNRENYDEFDYRTSINFNFNLNKYIVFNNQVIFFEKKYSEQLTEKEIDKMIKELSKNHIKFIEQKIAEKENK